jgi:diaminopimelate epimerase
LILIAPPSAGVEADVRMEMYNADGSRGEMCGNGIRCVAKYAVERGLVTSHEATLRPGSGQASRRSDEGSLSILTELNTAVGGFFGDTLALNAIEAVDLRVETDRGVLDLTAFTANGVVKSVRVDMGPPILDPQRIGVRLDGPSCVARPIAVDGERLSMTCVSMGNPHAVFFVSDVAGVDLARLGPRIERHELFPNRVNVHFAQCLSRDEARMRTWERGTGPTQACGTGACAVVVAGGLENRLDERVQVHLPGGDLLIERGENGNVYKTGPAEEVFEGVWPMEAAHGR